MFFIVSKILSYLLNPLFWIFSLLILAYFHKNKTIGRKLLLISLIAFYLFSNRFICDEFIRRWEVDYPENTSFHDEFDVGIVLGGQIVNYDSQKARLIFKDQADRLLQAVDLYKQGKIKKVLLTGGPGHLIYRDQFEASFMKTYLLKLNIPENDIMVDSISDNTYQNAVFSKKLLDGLYPTGGKYLLITSSLHTRRSIAIFNKACLNVTAFPCSKITGKRLYNFDHLFMPHLNSFEYWRDLMHEWVGFIVYRIMGYL
ncbi:MAG: YdcF family protein [Bacteroidota bacterium]